MPVNPNIQSEVLRVDFVTTGLPAAEAQRKQFVDGMKRAASDITAAGKTADFGAGVVSNLKASQAAVDDLIRKIDQAKSRAGQLAPATIARRADEAIAQRSADALNILRGGSGGGRFFNQDPSVSAAARNAGRLNLGRQAADVGTTAALGMDPLLIAIQQGPQVFDAMATSGLSLSKSALVTAGAFAGIAVAGIAIVKYTQSVRAEAERLLKVQEKIEGSTNRQALALKESVDSLAAARQQRDADSALSDRLAGSTEELEKRKALLEQLNELNRLNRTESGVADRNQRNAEILAIEDQLIQRVKDRQAAENEAFEQRNELFKKRQAAEAAEEAERAAAFRKSVDEAIAKTEELGNRSREVFADLRREATDNPFVPVFDEADKAIARTRINTAALSEDLRNAAAEMVATLNANRLFDARLQNALKVSDLRAEAASLRGGGGSVQIDQQIRDRLASLQRQEERGDFRNPTFALRQSFASASPGLRLELFDEIRRREESSGLFRNPIFQEQQRQLLSRDAAAAGQGGNARERFARQLAIINSQRPENDAQRASADRAIIDIGRTLGDEATSADRDAIAGAMERQATRLERQEQDAKALQEQDRETNRNIDRNISELLKIAKTEGLTGTIRIINEAENLAKTSLTPPRPTEANTRARSAN